MNCSATLPRIVPSPTGREVCLIEHVAHVTSLADAVKESQSGTLVRAAYTELFNVARMRELEASNVRRPILISLNLQFDYSVTSYTNRWTGELSSTLSVGNRRVNRELFERNLSLSLEISCAIRLTRAVSNRMSRRTTANR